MKTSTQLIDSHCHLQSIDLSEYKNSLDFLMAKAEENNIVHMLCVCTHLEEVKELRQIVDTYSQTSISVGIHPTEESKHEPTVEELCKLADYNGCIAIGETGLDYFRTNDEANKQGQRHRFITHIQASLACKKPLIIHTREASEDTISLMRGENAAEIGGVMHCFTESWEVAKKALDLNFYISFSGIVTFKNAQQIQEVAKKVPLDRMLIETDSPYLAPVPFRGKQNYPGYVTHVAHAISELRQLDFAKIAEQTKENFYKCFNIAVR